MLVLLGLSVRRFATKALVSALASNTNKTQTKKQTKHNKTKDYYELGVILTRKKLFTQATKNLEKAKKVWDGDEAELAQVHNALGFCYFQMAKVDAAIAEYERAVAFASMSGSLERAIFLSYSCFHASTSKSLLAVW